MQHVPLESEKKQIRATMHLSSTLLTDLPVVANRYRDTMLEQDYSPCTVNRRLALMKKVLKKAYREWGWLREPYHDRIILASEEGTARTVFLTPDQVNALCASLDDQAAMIVRLAVNTGLRRSEIWRLQPEDLEDGWIIVRKAKNKKPRRVPAPADLDLSLPITMSDWEFRKQWEPARDAAGLTHVRFHDLRHTFGSWTANDPSVPLTAVRDVMGHCGLQVTSRYVHTDDEVKASISDALRRKTGT